MQINFSWEKKTIVILDWLSIILSCLKMEWIYSNNLRLCMFELESNFKLVSR